MLHPSQRQWLTATGSLTAKLEKKAQQPLRIQRIYEGYVALSLVEKRYFGYQGHLLNRPIKAWVREVYLYGNDDKPWVKARSIFPLMSLQGNAKRLKHLYHTPIGYVLFKKNHTLPHQREIEKMPEGWQRRTLYDWYGRKILISEIFLPHFLESKAI